MKKRQTLQSMCVGILGLAFIACASNATDVRRPIAPAASESNETRQTQVHHLRRFDEAVQSIPVDCQQACEEQNHICTLSTRLCTMSRELPMDARAREACEAGSDTCRNATNRIPDSCLCDA